MRKLIIAVLVLISLDSFAQPTNYTWYKQRIRQYSLMLDSMLYIPRYNGTPSGVRANENSAIDGAIAVDTANGRQYFYYNGSWRRLANYSELGVDSIWRVAGKDSIFWSKAGNTYKIKDSTGGGGSSGGGIGSFQDSVANVLDYGAVGDGVTDDGIAIKAAIATGRTVYFPKGNYKTDSTLMPVVDKQVFYGDGSSSQLYTTQTTRAIIKIPLGIDSCTVQNLSFLGTSTSGSLPGFTNSSYQMGVWVNSIANKVRGCTFTKLVRGVYLFDGAVTPMENNIVSDCYFKVCYAGIENDYGSDYGLYVDNQMYGCYAAIIEGGAGNQYYGNTVATYGHYGYYSRGGNLHSSMVNMSFNHNTSGMTIPQGSLGLTITNSNFWFSTIDLGTTDTVKNLAFVNCVVAGTTINATRVTQSSMVGGYWYYGNTLTGSGLSYEQIGKNTYSAGLPRYLMDTLSAGTDTTGYKLALFNPTGKYLRYFPLSSLGTGGGGGTPGGSNKQFQYNNSSSFGGSGNLTQETNQVLVTGSSTSVVPFRITPASGATVSGFRVDNYLGDSVFAVDPTGNIYAGKQTSLNYTRTFTFAYGLNAHSTSGFRIKDVANGNGVVLNASIGGYLDVRDISGIGGGLSFTNWNNPSTGNKFTNGPTGFYTTVDNIGAKGAPVSTLDASGSFGAAITTTTSNLTLTDAHHTVIITSGTPTITLPTASGCTRRIYVVVNQTGSAVTVSTYKDFGGSDATTIAANGSHTFQSNGTNWYRIQ